MRTEGRRCARGVQTNVELRCREGGQRVSDGVRHGAFADLCLHFLFFFFTLLEVVMRRPATEDARRAEEKRLFEWRDRSGCSVFLFVFQASAYNRACVGLQGGGTFVYCTVRSVALESSPPLTARERQVGFAFARSNCQRLTAQNKYDHPSVAAHGAPIALLLQRPANCLRPPITTRVHIPLASCSDLSSAEHFSESCSHQPSPPQHLVTNFQVIIQAHTLFQHLAFALNNRATFASACAFTPRRVFAPPRNLFVTPRFCARLRTPSLFLLRM